MSKSVFENFIALLEKSDNTHLCGAVNESCNNQCELCPFGNEEKTKHVINSLKVINLTMGNAFRANEPE